MNRNLYAIPTTTALIGFDGGRVRGEVAVAGQLQAMDILADPALEARFVRVGVDRNHKLIHAPILAGYVFAEMNDAEHDRGVRVDGAFGRSLKIIRSKSNDSGACMDTQARKFLAALSLQREKAERAAESRDKAAMCAFKVGEALDIVSGPFMEMLAHFQGIDQKAHEPHPMVEADVTLFGRRSKVRIDPLDVKGAA